VAPKTIDELQAQIEQLSQQLADTPMGDTAGRTAIRDMMAGLQESANELTGFDQSLQRTLKTFTGITDASDTFAGSMLKLSGETDGAAKMQAQAEEVFKKTFNTLNVGISVLRKVAESTFAMAKENDKAVASFNRSSGAAGVYNAELISLEQTNRKHGISTAEMGESYSSLMGNLSGFGVMAESERMRLGELGAQYAKIGVSSADFAGSLETMTSTLGMSTQAATGMIDEARVLAQTLGKDVGQVLSEMNQALPQLAQYGADAVDMFKDLEKQAQRTGIAVGELVGIAGNYMTFDSAADAAGNLNAALNTQAFSTMGFLEANLEGTDSLIDYVQTNLANSMQSWDSMNVYQRQAIASAANMDVATLSNLMNAEAQADMDDERATSLEASMQAGISLYEQLTIFAKQFAIAVTPVMNWLTAALGKINSALDVMRNNWDVIGAAIKGAFVVTTIFAFGKAIMSVVKAIKDLTIAEAIRNAFTGPLGWGKLAVGGAIAGAAIAGIKALSPSEEYARGTDNASGRMALVGEEGPELLVPPPHSAVVNNTTMTDLAKQGNGGGNNTAVVAAVQALGSKLDAVVTALNASGDFVMQVDEREFGRVINNHLGEPGYRKIDIRTA